MSESRAPALWPSAVLPGDPEPLPAPTKPPGYVTAEQAYSFISTLPYEVALQVAKGETPTHALWGDRVLTMMHVRAAREFMSAGEKGSPAEINARMDGPIKQVVEKQGTDAETRAILSLLSSLPPLPAQRRSGGE